MTAARMLFTVAVAVVVTAPASAAPPRLSAPVASWTAFLSGTWHCTSEGQTYTVAWTRALSGRWIRGINRSGTSESEDLMTFDPATRRWSVFDFEPDGTSSILEGPALDARRIGLTTTRGAPLDLAIERTGRDAYVLRFRTNRKGKPVQWTDDCVRGAPR